MAGEAGEVWNRPGGPLDIYEPTAYAPVIFDPTEPRAKGRGR